MRRSNVKLGLAAIGAVLFLVGVRRDDAALRWVGIGWFAVAFLTRFIDRAPAPARGAGGEPEGAADQRPATEGRAADG